MVQEAIRASRQELGVLVLSYTECNQREIRRAFVREHGFVPSNVFIKGWFSFLLQDFVRPYRPRNFAVRVEGILLNSSNPHVLNGRTIRGRRAIINGELNPSYFLTSDRRRAHSAFLSKLALEAEIRSGGLATCRLSSLVSSIFVDEVQDLVGWDYEILEKISGKEGISLYCVGDFRQTVYSTSPGRKAPRESSAKRDKFLGLGFQHEGVTTCHRSVQAICNLSDLIFQSSGQYSETQSLAVYGAAEHQNHVGVFVVSPENARRYLASYRPMILRNSARADISFLDASEKVNFGESKGCTYDRTLIVPTDKIRNFFRGNLAVFDRDSTEQARNKFYVAITRARFSVAVILEGAASIPGVQEWNP